MLFDFPHLLAGFKEDEWESIPRTDKVIIRDYHLHGGNVEATAIFGYFETDRSVRGARQTYGLRSKPILQFSLADIHLPLPSPAGRPR